MIPGIRIRLTHIHDGVLLEANSLELNALYSGHLAADEDGWVEVFPANESHYMMFQGTPQALKVEIAADSIDPPNYWAD